MQNWEDAARYIENIREKAKREYNRKDTDYNYNRAMAAFVGMTYTLTAAIKINKITKLSEILLKANKEFAPEITGDSFNPEKN